LKMSGSRKKKSRQAWGGWSPGEFEGSRTKGEEDWKRRKKRGFWGESWSISDEKREGTKLTRSVVIRVYLLGGGGERG